MQTSRLIDYHLTRDFGTKISVTFEFLRQNFNSLGKSLLLIAGPPILVASLFMGSFMGDMFEMAFNAGRMGDPTIMQSYMVGFFAQFIVMMIAYAAAYIAALATINCYILLYEQKKTSRISPGEVWAAVRARLGMYIGTVILYLIAIMVTSFVAVFIAGMVMTFSQALGVLLIIALMVGFFYVVIATSLIYIVRTYEERDFFDAIGRSINLVRGKWWSTFGLILVLGLIASVISYIFFIPGYIITIVSTLHNVSQPEQAMQNTSTVAVVFFGLYYASAIFLQSITQVGVAFQYFNLVERKEATGLMEKIDSIGQSNPAQRGEEHY